MKCIRNWPFPIRLKVHKPKKNSVYVMQSVLLKRYEIVQHVDIVTELDVLRFGYFSIEYVVV